MRKTLPTPERLREAFHYNPATGILTWRISLKNGIHSGDVAGNRRGRYIIVCLDGVQMAAHRVACAYMEDKWPEQEVDHRDRDGCNNAWANLRHASPSQSKMNLGVSKNNTVGIKGVRVLSSGRYQARINDLSLGTFATPEEAGDVYVAAARAIFGEFAYA